MAGVDVRTHLWPADRVHGLRPLGEAVARGRAAGPPGSSVAWLDTETTGLAGGTGTYVFLVGLARVTERGLLLTQFILRDLAAEQDMLAAVEDELRRADALVTFNGSRFDLPLLRTRYLMCRLRPAPAPAAHLDLMTLARRLWHRRLGGYSLPLLEQAVLRVDRPVDVPGWMIPSLYVRYLQTGDDALLEPVIAHNAWDILSLVALHGVAGDILVDPRRAPADVDRVGLARLLEDSGRSDAAAECCRAALEAERDPAARMRAVWALARHHRRRGHVDDLRDLWERELQVGLLPRWMVLERLAMLWEWELRDPARALAYARRAAACSDVPRPRLVQRTRRLEAKVTRAAVGAGAARPPVRSVLTAAPGA
ncbi:MAG: ribonuclease H-like domain-containing protein [Armatimonadota bacterium]|nr:ribonuclease H-like domain-containing protein [Armatimonadota bacterium]MDR7437971.1 ribonuclease H-like domain-containing protein [Armatimonadota bacterium]MDR7473097.1 ribonuclease H-like domain-containing protein [Armatimonadota bacterium]MDR7507425.1 ribonuclease H-like domain-containing protein [Armatimonadota bacterium]MDR7509434.1 ribonuclease H-like domain-containing protein [Armatimonadota bacterium]